MRKFLYWLFPIAAASVACFWPNKDVNAELAVCANGVCTMKESDYRQLQAFHKRAIEIYQGNDALAEKMAHDIEGLQGALARCQSQQKRPL